MWRVCHSLRRHAHHQYEWMMDVEYSGRCKRGAARRGLFATFGQSPRITTVCMGTLGKRHITHLTVLPRLKAGNSAMAPDAKWRYLFEYAKWVSHSLHSTNGMASEGLAHRDCLLMMRTQDSQRTNHNVQEETPNLWKEVTILTGLARSNRYNKIHGLEKTPDPGLRDRPVRRSLA